MSPTDSKCMEIHIESIEKRSNLVKEIVKLMKKLREESHIKSFFFNIYQNKTSSDFIKLGLNKYDKFADNDLLNILNKYKNDISLVKTIKCDTRKVDGVLIDDIRQISCELFEIVNNNFKDGISKDQAFYLIHCLINQSGYLYNEEYELYESLSKAMKNT